MTQKSAEILQPHLHSFPSIFSASESVITKISDRKVIFFKCAWYGQGLENLD